MKVTFLDYTCIDCGAGTENQYKCDHCYSADPLIPAGSQATPYPPPTGWAPRLGWPHTITPPHPPNTPTWEQLASLYRVPRKGAPVSKRPRCRTCGRELCEALDAYYGAEMELAKLCVGCRRAS